MSGFPQSLQLLHGVRRRLMLQRLVTRVFLVTLALAGVYTAALLAGRLTGLWAAWFEPWTVLLVPAVALVLAALWPRHPGVQDAAHIIDQQQQTRDLFLTLTMLDSCPGEYQPLVGRDAELRAPKIKPAEVVPLQWERPTFISAVVLCVLLAGAYFVPTLDPFGKVAEAREEEDQRKLLEDSRKITEIRRAQLKNKNVEAENSPEVEKALEALKAGFSEMKKGDRRANQEKLKEHQDELGKIFRELINSPEVKKLNAEGLKADQKLGSLGEEEMFRKMQKELQQGSSESLEQQVDELKDKLERLTKTTDPLENSELQRQMQKQLKELSDFAGKKAGSKEMQAALERAQQQLDAMKQEGLSKEAMEALQESLEAAQQEMQMLAQEMRDMQNLEDALKLISMAKQLNSQDQLEGEMGAGNMTLEDYEELYQQLMGMQSGSGSDGDGEGTGGRGMGEGGVVDEDDGIKTDFVNEQSKSQIQKGKILLSLKTKGLSDSGDIKDDNYRRVIGEIRQSLEDVIEQEQIPPGYVGGIQKYFDTLEKRGE